MSKYKKRLHQPTDTIEHDGYPDVHGPEPFAPGSLDARRLAELVGGASS